MMEGQVLHSSVSRWLVHYLETTSLLSLTQLPVSFVATNHASEPHHCNEPKTYSVTHTINAICRGSLHDTSIARLHNYEPFILTERG